MNAFTEHALADLRHAEHYASSSAVPAAATRRAPVSDGVRRRLGVLLVEAGLHLMTRSEAVPAVSSPLAR
jgi:hypothetical protein